MLKSSLFFPGDELAHFVEQRGELVVVPFFLNTYAQAIQRSRSSEVGCFVGAIE